MCVCLCPQLALAVFSQLDLQPMSRAAKHSKDAPVYQLWPGVHVTFVAAHWKSFSMTVMCHVRVYVCVWSSTSDGPNSARTPTRTVTHHAQHSHALAEPPGRKKKRPQTAGRVAGRTALAQPHTSTTNILSLFSHNSTNTPLFALQLAAKMQLCAQLQPGAHVTLAVFHSKKFPEDRRGVMCVCLCPQLALANFSQLDLQPMSRAAKHSKDASMYQLWPGVHVTFVAAHWQKFLYDRHVSCACLCVCVVVDLRRTQLGANTNPDRNTPRTTLTRTR